MRAHVREKLVLQVLRCYKIIKTVVLQGFPL